MHAFQVTWDKGRACVYIRSPSGTLVSVASRRDVHAVIAGTVFPGRDGRTAALAFLDAIPADGRPLRLPNGDYAGVVFTPDRTYLFRECQARVPLFVRLLHGQIVEAGTSLSMLRGDRRLDGTYLCHYIVGADASQQHIRQTPFIDVERIHGGEVLEVASDGRRIDRWYSATDSVPAVSDESGAALAPLLQQRVDAGRRHGV